MSWRRVGLVEYASEDAPGYVIIQIGTGYEVHLWERRIGTWVQTWDKAVELIEQDMRPKDLATVVSVGRPIPTPPVRGPQTVALHLIPRFGGVFCAPNH